MISKNTIKRLNQLSNKKNRLKEQQFLVEGDKMVTELAISGYKIIELYITPDFESSHLKKWFNNVPTNVISNEELKKISQQKTPQNSLAVCKIPDQQCFPLYLEEKLSIYLDSIQDPGNLGTIFRICDWFGIQNLFISPDTVDMYNPKVIQASMGSFARVQVFETEFNAVKLLAQKSGASIYGTFMDGKNVYSQKPSEKVILVMGNEGNGISKTIESQVDEKLSIPNFSKQDQKAESLNVAIATAIFCSEFKREN